ncbi:hypothetical protein ABID95_000596 [Streptomyces atratus]
MRCGKCVQYPSLYLAFGGSCDEGRDVLRPNKLLNSPYCVRRQQDGAGLSRSGSRVERRIRAEVML